MTNQEIYINSYSDGQIMVREFSNGYACDLLNSKYSPDKINNKVKYFEAKGLVDAIMNIEPRIVKEW